MMAARAMFKMDIGIYVKGCNMTPTKALLEECLGSPRSIDQSAYGNASEAQAITMDLHGPCRKGE